MASSSGNTFFASPDRETPERVRQLAMKMEEDPLLRDMLEAFPSMAVIIGKTRQILMYNRQFDNAVPHSNDDLFLGMRLGECVGCEVAADAPAGCGTGKQCRMCGAVLSMLEAQAGRRNVTECSIPVHDDAGFHAIEFRVIAVPMVIAGEEVSLLSLVDISEENRRKALERIFFHDILNTASSVRSIAELLNIMQGPDRHGLIEDLNGVSDQLIEEIRSQRDLVAAERGDLQVEMGLISVGEILDHVHSMYRVHFLGRVLEIRMHNGAEGKHVTSDSTILVRVLGNLVKNALEASEAGDVVTLRCDQVEGGFHFSVHNDTVMPENVQLQMFRRSFSTKGSGRGLGTYSARLLTERYLGGKITFDSSQGKGTTFSIFLPFNGIEQADPEVS
ncbi:MAG: HAMP domain-containing histidine kinase [Bacteroidetes bacterium]|nr:HAMP domain-containing histidine kinase [Bacteroidota bacterium]